MKQPLPQTQDGQPLAPSVCAAPTCAVNAHNKPGPLWFLVLLLKMPVWGYRKLLSPLLGPRCRFYPSCSQYALEALETFGPFRGSLLAFRRLLRCHPFHPGGVDAVPLPREDTVPLSLEDTAPLPLED